MKAKRAQRIRLGTFIVVGFVLLVALLAVVIGEQLLQDRFTYYVDFQGVSVNGLRVGSSVLYNGIEVGTVADTRFAPGSVEHVVATLLLDQDVPIKADAKARLAPVGITGNMQIEIHGATDEAETLKPGSRIPASSSTLDLISEPVTNVANDLIILINRMSSILDESNQDEIAETLRHVAGILRENREPIHNILANIDTLIDDEGESIARIIDQIDETSRSLSSSAANLESVFGDVEEGGVDQSLPSLMEQVSATLTQADGSVRRIEGVILDAEMEFQENLDLLAETLEYLNIFASKISENPSELIR